MPGVSKVKKKERLPAGRQVIGITGGVASGKSMAVREFRRLGARVVDTDKIAHEVVRPGSPLLKRIKKNFGPGVFRGRALDRRSLGRIVFSSPAKRRKLEALLHPSILKRMREQIRRVRRGVVVVEIPLLFEKRLQKSVDLVAVVWAPEAQQLRRLRRKTGLPSAEAKSRIRSQWPLNRKAKAAHVVFRNSGSPKSLRQQIRRFWKSKLLP